jgi:CUB/sushi domain-containing protein
VYLAILLRLFCPDLSSFFPLSLVGFDLVKCEDPGTPNYGYRIRDEGHFTDTVVLYSCNPGYAMHGSSALTCLSGDRRVWDKPVPSCVGECGSHNQVKEPCMRLGLDC